jgi:hypothetical protein
VIAALAAGLLLFGLVDVVGRVIGAVGARQANPTLTTTDAPGTATGPSPSGGAAAVPGLEGGTYVVQPGDSLWSIALRLKPGDDPRPVVDELSRRAGGAALRPGQRLDVQGL